MLMSFNVDVRSFETEYSISGFIGQAALPYSLLSPGLKAHRLSSFCVYVNSTATSPSGLCFLSLLPIVSVGFWFCAMANSCVYFGVFVLCVYGSPVGNLERVSITGKTDWDLGLERLGFLL